MNIEKYASEDHCVCYHYRNNDQDMDGLDDDYERWMDSCDDDGYDYDDREL
jgi:hypothetical protein